MKHLLAAIIAWSAALAAAAQTNTYSINVGDFDEIKVVNGVNIVHKQSADSAGLAVFSGRREVISAITFQNKNSKLQVEAVYDDQPIDNLPTVTVYSTFLKKVVNWGDSTVVVEKLALCPEFSAKIIGNGEIVVKQLECLKAGASVDAGSGHIVLKGKTKQAKYGLMSAGTIEAGELEAATVSINLFGIGSIDCFATETLSVKGVSGNVYYHGHPAQIKNKSVGLKLTAVD